MFFLGDVGVLKLDQVFLYLFTDVSKHYIIMAMVLRETQFTVKGLID